jgi:hypothetical protein
MTEKEQLERGLSNCEKKLLELLDQKRALQDKIDNYWKERLNLLYHINKLILTESTKKK